MKRAVKTIKSKIYKCTNCGYEEESNIHPGACIECFSAMEEKSKMKETPIQEQPKKKFGFNNKQPSKRQKLMAKLEKKGIVPSHRQDAIFDWIENGKGNAMGIATAGSGKTTTLVWASEIVPTSNALFLAFNKHIAKELNSRLADGWDCKTIHSLGFGMLARGRKLQVEGFKYHRLLQKKLAYYFPSTLCYVGKGDNLRLTDGGKVLQKEIMRFIDLSRLTQMDDLWELANNYGLPFFELTSILDQTIEAENTKRKISAMAIAQGEALTIGKEFDLLWFEANWEDPIRKSGRELLRFIVWDVKKQGLSQFEQEDIIDFTDMIWIPVHYNMKPRWKYDFIFIDEFQDLNKLQLEIALKVLKPNGRLLAVGDPHQSIYAFAGATQDAMQIAGDRLQAKELPLDISYRCPRSHIELAQQINPSIQPAPDAEEGLIERVDAEKIPQLVKDGDLIICRKTAPLIELTLKLIGEGLPAKMRGRDISKDLVTFLDKVLNFQLKPDFEAFPVALQNYYAKQLKKLQEDDYSEAEQEALIDRVLCLDTLYKGTDAQSYDEMKRFIESLFTEERASIWLSTVHKAKGLEGPRIWVYGHDVMPMTWKNQKPFEKQQEENILFIALTRSKAEMFLVDIDEEDENMDKWGV